MYVLLFRLDLGGCLRLTDEAVIKLAESCSKTLTWMNLSGGSSIQSLSPIDNYCYYSIAITVLIFSKLKSIFKRRQLPVLYIHYQAAT